MKGTATATYQQTYEKDFIQGIALQCAPVLMKVKVSNLLIVRPEEVDQVKEIFAEHVLRCYPLLQCEKRAVFLIYHEVSLMAHLNSPEQKNFMRKMGYAEIKLEGALSLIALKYRTYSLEKESFPHEIGILLGYPTKDVEAFMVCRGHGYLAAGYWKVYHDLPQAMAAFKRYDAAKISIAEKLEQGYSLKEIADQAYTKSDRIDESVI